MLLVYCPCHMLHSPLKRFSHHVAKNNGERKHPSPIALISFHLGNVILVFVDLNC
jgi:hypothetical protein